MADTFVVGQVNVCDQMRAEEDPVLAIAGERSDGDALTSERLRDFPEATLKADVRKGRPRGGLIDFNQSYYKSLRTGAENE